MDQDHENILSSPPCLFLSIAFSNFRQIQLPSMDHY